jgi:hypothetical protein
VIDQSAIEKILRRGTQMRGDRNQHEATWRDCFDLSFPERGSGLQSGTSDSAADIQRRKVRMLDSTGRDALRTLCAGIIGGVVPSNQQWAELDAGRESEAERYWLSEAARMVWESIHDSNFDAEIMDCMQDMGPAGWFVLYVEEAEQGGYQFESWPIAECFIGQSRKAGPVDVLYRYSTYSVEQLVDQFGKAAVSEKVRQQFDEGKLDQKHEVVRAIQPRRASNGFLAKNMPYESVTLECGTRHLLRESGYHEFPCVVPRWNRLPSSVYATGPYLDALGDIRTLNMLVANELASTDIAVSGMWIAKSDGVLNASAIKIGPRKVVIAADTDNLKALSTGADFEVAWTEKAQLQAQIRRTLMANQLEPQDKPDMTAFEVHTRVQMLRQLLGPVFGRFQAEFLTPLIERCFGIAYRAGALGPMPRSLTDRVYSVRYKSPLARAQMQEDVIAIETSLEATGRLAEARGGDESVWDTVDLDEAQRAIYEGRGVPMRILRKQEDIAARRDAREKAAEEQRQQMQQDEARAAMVKHATAA